MGYYTQYELEIIDGDIELIEKFRSECEAAKYAINGNGESQECCKWYEHETDLRKFSKKHPEVLFGLSGEGEESGDIWREYYRNGKMQSCKERIVIPEFNASLLK